MSMFEKEDFSKTKLTKYPNVSLIISNFNGKNLLRDCLTSLFIQDYLGSYEIIVVDSGSNDGAPEMVEQEFPNVKLFKKNRIGIGEAINYGIKMADGELLAFDINSDEVFSSNWLQSLVDVLIDNPRIGVVGGVRLLYGTQDIVDEAGVRFDFLGIPSSNIRAKLSEIPNKPFEVDYVGAPLFRKKILEIVGFCDETYFIYAEDEDFCARIKKAGCSIVLVPQAISIHRRSVTISQLKPLAVYYERRNHIRFILIHFSIPRVFFALFWYIFILTAVESITFIPFVNDFVSNKDSRLFFLSQRATKKNFRAIIEAIIWNFRNIKRTLSFRRRAFQINKIC